MPLIVNEGYEIGPALARSRELVAGRALKVFWVLLVAALLTAVLSAAAERLALELVSPAPAVLLSAVFDTMLLTPFLALTLSSLYYALNDASVPATAPAT